jgi:hypothetical protein
MPRTVLSVKHPVIHSICDSVWHRPDLDATRNEYCRISPSTLAELTADCVPRITPSTPAELTADCVPRINTQHACSTDCRLCISHNTQHACSNSFKVNDWVYHVLPSCYSGLPERYHNRKISYPDLPRFLLANAGAVALTNPTTCFFFHLLFISVFINPTTWWLLIPDAFYICHKTTKIIVN